MFDVLRRRFTDTNSRATAEIALAALLDSPAARKAVADAAARDSKDRQTWADTLVKMGAEVVAARERRAPLVAAARERHRLAVAELKAAERELARETQAASGEAHVFGNRRADLERKLRDTACPSIETLQAELWAKVKDRRVGIGGCKSVSLDGEAARMRRINEVLETIERLKLDALTPEALAAKLAAMKAEAVGILAIDPTVVA